MQLKTDRIPSFSFRKACQLFAPTSYRRSSHRLPLLPPLTFPNAPLSPKNPASVPTHQQQAAQESPHGDQSKKEKENLESKLLDSTPKVLLDLQHTVFSSAVLFCWRRQSVASLARCVVFKGSVRTRVLYTRGQAVRVPAKAEAKPTSFLRGLS